MDDRKLIIDEILIPSLKKLYREDYINILWKVSERNICARLAHHMENTMREYDESHESHCFDGYYADVEYNRMGNGDLKRFENFEKVPQYMVSDLLIQSRGHSQNLLAVEMKRSDNYKNRKGDKERLMSLVSSSVQNDSCVHNTLLGAFIVYSKDKVKIDFFEDNGWAELQSNPLVLSLEELRVD